MLLIAACAVLATAFLWTYMKMHLAPFAPLQQKIAKEYLRSRPRVEGGQRKMHQNSPRILRITMKVDFDPVSDTPTAESFVNRVASFIQSETDLAAYDELEIHLYMLPSEKEIRQKSFRREIPELLKTPPSNPET